MVAGGGGAEASTTNTTAFVTAMAPPPTPSKVALMNSAVGGGDLAGCGLLPHLVHQATTLLLGSAYQQGSHTHTVPTTTTQCVHSQHSQHTLTAAVHSMCVLLQV